MKKTTKYGVYYIGKPSDLSFCFPANGRPSALQKFFLRKLLGIYYKEFEL